MKDIETIHSEPAAPIISKPGSQMGEHTPGPWSVAPLHGKYYGTKVADAVGAEICTLWNHDYDGGSAPLMSEREEKAHRTPETTEEEWHEFLRDWLSDSHYEGRRDYANARLIAAAPDLLAELIALLNWAQAFGAFRDDLGEGVENHVSDLIAKATGGLPR